MEVEHSTKTGQAHACPYGSGGKASDQWSVSFRVGLACVSARSARTTIPLHTRRSSQKSTLCQLLMWSTRHSRRQDWVLTAKRGAALLWCAVLVNDSQNPNVSRRNGANDHRTALKIFSLPSFHLHGSTSIVLGVARISHTH